MSTGTIAFVVPADLERPTGGNRYDEALAAALRGLGVGVDERPSGPDDLAAALRADGPVLVDGLLACAAPDAVAGAVADGARVHVLVHLPLALETGLAARDAEALDALEARALRAATGVVATSRWAAGHLRERHALTRVSVATPGAEPAAPATGSVPPRLLHLASVTPRKDQLGVVEALAGVRDLPWIADLTGDLEADPGYAARVAGAIDGRGLGDRIHLTGPARGAALDAAWDAADLLLLPSHAETWGMAVTEGLARGVPAVVGRGTGAEEALGRAPDGGVPGAVVPPGDPAALAAALRHLLGAGRGPAVSAARARSATLGRWQDTARDVLEAVR